MAHFARLDENNAVINVIVVHNNELLDNGVESEAKGIAFCQSLLGATTKWVQTSYNKSFRKNYAGIGFVYREDIDAFIPPKPYPSWILNEDIGAWEPPIPLPLDAVDPFTAELYPGEGTVYVWNEDNQNWVEVNNV